MHLDIPARLRRLCSDRFLRAKARSSSIQAEPEQQLGRLEQRRKSNDAHIDAPAIAFVPFEQSASASPDGSPRDPLRRRLPRRLPSMTALLLCFPREEDIINPSDSSPSPLSYTDTKQLPERAPLNLSFSPSMLWSKMPKHGMATTTTTTTPTPTEGSPVMRARPLSLTLNRHSLELGDLVSSCGSGTGERLHTASLPPTPALKLRTEEVLLTSELDGLPVWVTKTTLEGYPEAHDRAIIFIHGLTATSDISWSHIIEDTHFHHSLLVPDAKNSGNWLARPLIRYDLRHHGQSVVAAETLSGLCEAAATHPVSSAALVSDFKAVCANSGITSTLLVGWSIGATVATDIVAAAAATPASGFPTIQGLVWISPFPWVSLTPRIIDEEVVKVCTPLFESGAKQLAAAAAAAASALPTPPSSQFKSAPAQDENADPAIGVAKMAFVDRALHPEGSNLASSGSATLPPGAPQLHTSSLSLPTISFFQYCTRTDNDPSPLITAVRSNKLRILHLHGEKDGSIKCEETISALREVFGVEEGKMDGSGYETVKIAGAGHGLPVFRAKECMERMLEWIGRVEEGNGMAGAAATTTAGVAPRS